MTVSIASGGVPASLSAIIQDNTLQRMFHDALYPANLWRSEATPELWQANLGESSLQTRTGLLTVDTTPITPGTDPTPETYDVEQWRVEAAQYTKTMDTHMPTSYVAIAPKFLKDTATLGLNAAQTLNRLARDRVMDRYIGGQTNLTAAALAAATQVDVASLNGFTENLQNGRPAAVSASNPIAIDFNGVAAANTVIGAIPANPANPLGPGTLLLGAALSGPLALRDVVRASNRSFILRVGGSASVDGLTGANILTLQSVINATALLRQANVPPTADGFYHVHLTPTAEAEIFQDNQFQRLLQSLPDSAQYRDLAIGQLVGCRFYRNTENPLSTNVGALVDTSGGGAAARAGTGFHGDVINQTGVNVERTMVLGGGLFYEKYLDESQFITAAGVTGKIGEFSVTNGGIQVMTNRIRYIARSPSDRLQQVVSQTWSWSGDFGVPSDQTTGGASRFKRAVVIEHA